MDRNRKCPICGGEFEDGVLFVFGAFGWKFPGVSWWDKVSKKFQLIISPVKTTTYKCKNCGYLESYAK